jgi:hypothetical protein
MGGWMDEWMDARGAEEGLLLGLPDIQSSNHPVIQ